MIGDWPQWYDVLMCAIGCGLIGFDIGRNYPDRAR